MYIIIQRKKITHYLLIAACMASQSVRKRFSLWRVSRHKPNPCPTQPILSHKAIKRLVDLPLTMHRLYHCYSASLTGLERTQLPRQLDTFIHNPVLTWPLASHLPRSISSAQCPRKLPQPPSASFSSSSPTSQAPCRSASKFARTSFTHYSA